MSGYKKNTLKRNSILRLKAEIQSLFDNGKKEYLKIIKVIWTCEANVDKGDLKIFVSVPKRLISRAVNRNIIKRRVREALRLNLGELRNLCDENNIYMTIGVVYISQSIEEYNEIEQKIILSLQKIYSKVYESI